MSDLINRCGDFLLAKGIDAERSRASLTARCVNLSFGTLAFYTTRAELTVYPDAVILLHGAGADKTSWIRFARHLGSRVPVIIPDLPGHGQSCTDPTLDYSIAAQVQYIVELMTALSIQRAHLIGNSMGGAVAIALAAVAPDKVSSLILISSAGTGQYGALLTLRVAQTGHNPMVTIASNADFRTMLRFAMAKPPYLPGLLLSAMTRERVRRNTINEQVAAAIEKDLDQTLNLSTIATPTLIIWGDRDRVLPIQNASLLRQGLIHSKVVVLKDIGHAPMVESPRHVADLCRDFLSQQCNA